MIAKDIRNALIKYGEDILEKGKREKTGGIFKYSIDPEYCAEEEYKTIIDVLDGLYQSLVVSGINNADERAEKVLEGLFDVLCTAAFETCDAVFDSPEEKLAGLNAYADKLYNEAVCDDVVISKNSMEIIFTEGTILTSGSETSMPFAGSNFNKDRMIRKFEYLLDQKS